MRELQVDLVALIIFVVFAIDVVTEGVQVTKAESRLLILEVDRGARGNFEAESIIVEARTIAKHLGVRQIIVIVKPPQRRANAPWLLVYHRVLGISRRNARCTQSRQTSSRYQSLHTCFFLLNSFRPNLFVVKSVVVLRITQNVVK